MIGISNCRKVGGYHFRLLKLRSSDKDLDFYLKQFTLSDYIILKASGSQRLVSEEDFLTFVYSKYIFFRKDIYNTEHIERWLYFIKYNKIDVNFLDKPFPPIELLDKIKIIDNL